MKHDLCNKINVYDNFKTQCTLVCSFYNTHTLSPRGPSKPYGPTSPCAPYIKTKEILENLDCVKFIIENIQPQLTFSPSYPYDPVGPRRPFRPWEHCRI